MLIDETVLERATGLKAPAPFVCHGFALATQPAAAQSLAFLDDAQFLSAVADNAGIAVVLTTPALKEAVLGTGRVAIVTDDPRHDFYQTLNVAGREHATQRPTFIDPTAVIHPRATISGCNVHIGPRCIIEPGAVILPDVTMGAECIIRANAVVGTEGYEYKRTSRGLLPVFHDGSVVLGDRVEVGGNSCLDKGFHFRHTQLGNDTKVDNLVHIAHGVHTGQRCLIVAHAMVAGSVTLGNDVWVGPGAMISNGLTVGDGASISLGAVVTKSVPAGARVSGNFAVPHEKLLRHVKSISAE
ncbi:UDP-3-O-(3-hydroxymyristoyl)glucosamine N-acyltransferase [Gemmatimonas phototrophica]|uniref:UDP-3-O-(3-hydroxymyristoyl) glucosamine N-acyltransferase n=1 Tax=Gemmatimonas phototrophica TaxID=1379270 RepID=A0A143BHD8_9BACT|nr:UDP-3-O-(3-hydroxymyristoyl)glucosamine N-acyltransferase [Gemmatimonas phototrophica]AMW04035.1 hypothetical protein GEMMAAP_02645 [Gemmatimonas phototrophica]